MLKFEELRLSKGRAWEPGVVLTLPLIYVRPKLSEGMHYLGLYPTS